MSAPGQTVPRLRAAGDTHAGLQRDNNEDRFFFDDRRGVFCVIDGVGGQLAGERAAEIAAETLRTRLVVASSNGSAAGMLRDALAAANDAIFLAASQDRSLNGMACVATIAVADGERVRFGHVGDTRMFKIRQGAISKLTRDHSPVGELEDAGALTEIEAMRHPRRNEIYRDLGSQPRQRDDPAFIEIGDAPFERDAALVLCSDGLSDLVSSGSVRRIVEAHAGAPALAVQELITAANDAGGKDNVTVLVVEGDRFAESVAARGGRRAASRVGVTRETASPATATTVSAAERPRTTLYASLALATGVLLGIVIVLGIQYTGWSPARALRALGVMAPAVSAPRTWRVGLDATADFPTIGEALAQAVAGDTVEVGEGEYREGLQLPAGVALIGSRKSVLHPPLGARADWVAITVKKGVGGRVAGFRLAASPEQRLGTGILVEGGSVELDDLDIAGTSVAGVDFRSGGSGVLRRSFVHDNAGPGVVVRGGAEPRLEFNVIHHNGSGPGSSAPGVLVEAGARPTLVGNGIGGGGGPAVAGWPPGGLAELARQNVLSPAPGAAAPAPAGRVPRNRTQ
jgi:serine/threonine protein phosphatase PrpC